MHKKDSQVVSLFALLGSALVKALHKMLLKSTPERGEKYFHLSYQKKRKAESKCALLFEIVFAMFWNCSLRCKTVKLGCNEHAWDWLILFGIAVIHYNRGGLCIKWTIWDQKFQPYFLVINVFVITEYDSSLIWGGRYKLYKNSF